MDLREKIRTVPDFPQKGIMFRDITTLLKDKSAFKEAVLRIADKYRDEKIDKIVAAESRGFIFGAALSYELNTGFVPVRKPGKLPAETLKEEYELEYGTDALEIHLDAILEGENVLIVDDLIATGGTIKAVARMVEKLGGNIIGMAFLIDLTSLHGDIGYDSFSLIQYDSE